MSTNFVDVDDDSDVWEGLADDDLIAVDLENLENATAVDAESKFSTVAGKSESSTGDAKSESSPNKVLKRKYGGATVCTLSAKQCKLEEEKEDEEPLAPLERLRGGYLWVSDFCAQMWCEQQMEYRLTLPPEAIIKEPEEVSKGSELHLARELEVQEYVNVEVTSSEDIFAVKVINLLIALRQILTSSTSVHREVPIFGVVDGVFIMGKIDELRLDRETFNLDIIDLKTRKTNKPPGKSQKNTHNAQVMLYKLMYDDLVRGLIPRHSLTSCLGLDLGKTLGPSVTKHITSGLMSHGVKKTEWSVNPLLDELRNTCESLPFASQLFIDYVWQEDGQTFLMEEVKYDGEWLEKQLTKCLSYWKGKRKCTGVDIEEAWKCHYCDFQETCSWIAKKTAEIQSTRKTYKYVTKQMG